MQYSKIVKSVGFGVFTAFMNFFEKKKYFEDIFSVRKKIDFF